MHSRKQTYLNNINYAVYGMNKLVLTLETVSMFLYYMNPKYYQINISYFFLTGYGTVSCFFKLIYYGMAIMFHSFETFSIKCYFVSWFWNSYYRMTIAFPVFETFSIWCYFCFICLKLMLQNDSYFWNL